MTINLRHLTTNYDNILDASEIDRLIAGVNELEFITKFSVDAYTLTKKSPLIKINKLDRYIYKVNTFKYFAIDYINDYFVWEISEAVPSFGYETAYI